MSHANKTSQLLLCQTSLIKIGAPIALENFYKSTGFINRFRALLWNDALETFIMTRGTLK